MKKLTFVCDVQLNDNEDWIEAGTVVTVSDNIHHVNKYEHSVPVVVNEAYDMKGNKKKVNDTIVWFSKGSFVELGGM